MQKVVKRNSSVPYVLYEVSHPNKVWYKVVLGSGKEKLIADRLKNLEEVEDVVKEYSSTNDVSVLVRDLSLDFPESVFWLPTVVSSYCSEEDSDGGLSCIGRVFASGPDSKSRTVTLAHEFGHKKLGHHKGSKSFSLRRELSDEKKAWGEAKKTLVSTGSWDDFSRQDAIKSLASHYLDCTDYSTAVSLRKSIKVIDEL